jgi:hypothetical protein
MLQCPPGWAIDAYSYDTYRNKFTEVVVLDVVKGLKHSVAADYFDGKHKVLDRGYGRQYYLTLPQWHTEDIVGDEEGDEPDIECV